MGKILALVDGYKSYIVAGLIGIGAAAQALGYHIPDWVWPLLGSLGLGTVRSAIGKVDGPGGA